MAGNREFILETIADPDELVEGESGETLALRVYQQTNLTAKTAVVAYRRRARWVCQHRLVDLQAGPGAARGVRVWRRFTIDRKLIPLLLQLPSHQPWIDYDAEGDVCISVLRSLSRRRTA